VAAVIAGLICAAFFEVARRALAITFATIPPNSVAIGVDNESRRVLIHLLRRGPAPEIFHEIESA